MLFAKNIKRLSIIISVLMVAVAGNVFASAVIFSDDFNRPDSPTVGNGWSDASGNSGGNLEIKNNELTSTVTTGGGATMYRPFSFVATTTVSIDLKETNGFGGKPRRYDRAVFVINDGSHNTGYGIAINRSDSINNNSSVTLWDNGVPISILPSSFQYGPEIHVEATFSPDGSVVGAVSQPGDVFNFSFPPHAIQSTGSNFAIYMGFADHRTSSFIFPRADNLVISIKELPVDIDIKPGSFPNSIHPKSNGVIPVAILTTPAFDATTVDPSTVRFGENGASEVHSKGHLEDVDGDGELDMVLHFKTRDTGIRCGNTNASLSGQTVSGRSFSGADSINTVGCR